MVIISLILITLCMLIRGDILRRNYLKMLVTLSGQRVKRWNHVRTVQARDIQHVYTLPHVVTPWKPRDSCLSNRSYAVGNPVIPTRAMHYNKATIGKGNKRNAYSSWRRWWKWTKARIQTRHFWLQEKRRMLKTSLIYKLNLITSNF